MDFSNYSARDFALNESFQKWVLEPDEEIAAFWDNWLTVHPDKTEIIVEARTMIRNIKSAIEKNVSRDRDEVWERIMKDIDDLKGETNRDEVSEAKNKE